MTRTHFQAFNRLDEYETEIAVAYTFSAGFAGSWEEPPDGPEIEIIKAELADGTEITLTDAEEQKFCDWIAENHEDDEGDNDYDC